MLDKRASRILAVQGIYDICWNNRSASAFDLSQYVTELVQSSQYEEEIVWGIAVNDKFVYRLLKYCTDNIQDVDSVIKDMIGDTWKMERIATPALAVIRIGISELASCPNNPTSVIMSEYIAIADAFLNKTDTAFVHGLLNGVISKYRPHDGQQSNATAAS